MFAQLVKIFKPSEDQLMAQNLYLAVVDLSRRPHFYRDLGVPDTLDGRFDMIVLHLFIVLQRLRSEDGTGEFQRLLTEAFFEDMDRSIREMGVSDTGVSKRVKRMATGFFGRVRAYEQALGNRQALCEALRRNLYGTVPVEEKTVERMAAYVIEYSSVLDATPLALVLEGKLGQ